MQKITLETAKQVVPMIYCYTTPEIHRHDGWVKIGYTEQDVKERLKQQSHTIDVLIKEEWRANAIFEDGSGDHFTDKDFHAYLRKQSIENDPKNEWFRIEPRPAKAQFNDFRENRGILKTLKDVIPYTLRDEQAEAVAKTAEYFHSHPNGEFLWNAKPRFGKTLSVYDFCKTVNAANVLIVTNRPAIANSWYSDYEQFFGTQSGYSFVSSADSLKGKPLCISRKDYVLQNESGDKQYNCIEFVSLQDLKGSIYFGGEYDKLKEVAEMNWDVLVIDEAHEGVDTYKTDVAFDHINRKFTLHLSGTPFKALANDKFPADAIYNWTYADEQRAKRDWHGEGENPYKNLPRLNLFTYQMSEIVKDEIEQGMEIDGEQVNFAFDLNEFFATQNGKFIHESSVDKFLDALTTLHKFPFSTDDLRKELKHTFWLLNRVDSAKALEKKLREHPVFSKYKIILAAGDGKTDDQTENAKSFDKVTAAIKEYEYTITLSVGQLTTGITIPEWSAVLMLSSIKSPSLYMQAAFRAQNPCLFQRGSEYLRKENAYVFDFDPARTLTIFEEFANDLSAETSDGRGDSDKRKGNVRELLNFFPVIGEDENGEMIELDAEKVLSIPRKIHAQEVVKRGFMSDFLFQNISNVFHAPMEVIEIIQQFQPVAEPKAKINVTPQTAEELSLDENGDINLSDDYVIGKATEIFGDKVYSIEEGLNDIIDELQSKPKEKTDGEKHLDELKNLFHTQAVAPIIETTKERYGSELKASEKNRLERNLKDSAEKMLGKVYGNYQIQTKQIEKEKDLRLSEAEEAEIDEILADFKKERDESIAEFQKSLAFVFEKFTQKAGEETVLAIETSKKEQEKKNLQNSIKDHLRGFSRTIPSFLMAYGDENVTLENFDEIIPDNVFLEVTSISLEQFRFLRDGGDYDDSETGETKHFHGNLFDPVVFNDSVKEFLNKREKLKNYFEETSTEDIFDYIPPQKTNQIFTPKWVVKKMVDMLEAENPDCFDDPDKTFADLYMKSGLYIAEIVKRLYRSEKMKVLFPDGAERLRHIFKNQVYGLAPTEIIYKIATRFILGFEDNAESIENNFKLADALPYAKEGKLQDLLDELYG